MKISLITACYNSAGTIGDAMESVLAQEGVDVEYIVVDGGSTDGTVALIEDFSRNRLRQGYGGREGFEFKWLSEPDKGMYDAINKGIGMATGDIVGILNADDMLESPSTLSHIAAGFGERVDALYADIRFVKDDLQTTVRYYGASHWKPWMHNWGYMPPHPSVYIRREVFGRLGGYKLGYRISADFELMVRYLCRNRIRAAYLPECVVKMRMGGKSTKNWRANVLLNVENVRANRENGYFSCFAMMLPGFGAWMETALNPPPALKKFNPEAVFLLLDSSHAVFDDASCKVAKTALEAAFPLTTVIVLDLEDLADEVDDFYDERMWKLGAMPWSMKGLRAIKDEVNRLVGMMREGRKKVLAVDFDNTLWAGVIGEDGVRGVRPYEAFQTGLKDLLGRGVLLAGLSKNNIEDVEPIWNDARMVLKRDDFVALRVDWKDKAGNLADVAKELNLGVDSFVFVDDNPAEREAMKALLPDVAVPDFPEDEHDHPRFLRHIARLYFPDMRMTEEDRKKTEQYQEEAERKKFAANLSVEDYLKGLEIWADIHQIREQEFPRVAQLSQKTNQFNVLTNRYSIDEVARFSQAENCLLLTVHAGDRFGDQGLVAFVQAVIDGESATITDWVMSCRTMNRRLEFAVEEQLEKKLKERGVTTVYASWRRTLKNSPVSGLFESFVFEVLAADEAEKRYVLKLPRKAGLVHQVKIKGE